MSDITEDLIALAARAEAATGPDRELDLRISQAVNYGDVFDDCFEWKWGFGGDEIEGWRDEKRKPCAFLDPVQFVPRWTASIDAAKRVIPEDHSWAGGDCGEDDQPWACVTANFGKCGDFTGSGFNEASSLVAASLRARAAA